MRKKNYRLPGGDTAAEKMLVTALAFVLAVSLSFIAGTAALANLAGYFAIGLAALRVSALAGFAAGGLSFGWLCSRVPPRRLALAALAALMLSLGMLYFGDAGAWEFVLAAYGLGSAWALAALFRLVPGYREPGELWPAYALGVFAAALILLNWKSSQVFRYLGPAFGIILLAAAGILVWSLPDPEIPRPEPLARKDFYFYELIALLAFLSVYPPALVAGLSDRLPSFWASLALSAFGLAAILAAARGQDKQPALITGTALSLAAPLCLLFGSAGRPLAFLLAGSGSFLFGYLLLYVLGERQKKDQGFCLVVIAASMALAALAAGRMLDIDARLNAAAVWNAAVLIIGSLSVRMAIRRYY